MRLSGFVGKTALSSISFLVYFPFCLNVDFLIKKIVDFHISIGKTFSSSS